MTIGENLEQRVTGRADSYVPARTAGRLFRLREPDTEALERNLAMHWGTGMVVGVARALFVERGLRGLPASATHLESIQRTRRPPLSSRDDEYVRAHCWEPLGRHAGCSS